MPSTIEMHARALAEEVAKLHPGDEIPAGLVGPLIKAVKDADADPERAATYIAAAEEQWASDGEIEIDCDAVVSEGSDDGAYVAAWVWVDRPEDMDPYFIDEGPAG